MITIRNDFHNSEYRTPKSAEEIRIILNTPPDRRSLPTEAWVTKVRRTLCGISGCTCGGELSERPPMKRSLISEGPQEF